MSRRTSTAPLLALSLLLALLVPVTAQGAPLPVLDRVVPEPRLRTTYISHAEYLGYLDALGETYGDLLSVGSMGTTEQGRDMLEVELTDPASPIPYEERGVVYLSQGIHANEPGGREGMLRVIEDLLADAAADDPATLELLGSLRIVQTVPNVDGWVRGDVVRDDPGTLTDFRGYTRENRNGIDLNRQLPWPGRVAPSRDFASHAESRALVADADARRARGERVVATADVHGMLQDDAAVWTMLSSGQFDLGGWARQVHMGRAIEREVTAALEPHALLVLAEAAGGPVVPHRLTTSSEFQGGLSGSGFYGDWLAQAEGLDAPSVSTIELFFNNGPAGTYNQLTYVPEIVQIHVDSVRGVVAGMLEAAVTDYEVAVALRGLVGVVDDPATVLVERPRQRTDAASVSPLRFFDDLDPYLSRPTVRIPPDQIDSAALADLDVLVLTSAVAAEQPAAGEAIAGFVAAGGTLVLTDDGLTLLPDLDGRFDAADLAERRTMIGNATFVDTAHPLAAGVRDGEHETALHTYEPATLGFNTEGSAGQAPVWTIDRTAFEDAGGATVATTGGSTSIGELTLGAGTVRVIGGLLPMPTLANDPPYGLYSYAVNDTGYAVLLNALDAAVDVSAVPARFAAAGE